MFGEVSQFCIACLILDSDDESDTDLAERLNGIDLDDADSVWDKLTDNERQEFEELLRKGDVTKIIIPWDPWWSFRWIYLEILLSIIILNNLLIMET